MTLKWVTNQPKKINKMELVAYWQDDESAYKQWRSQFIEGRPQATEELTVEQLEKFGMIGLYREEVAS